MSAWVDLNADGVRDYAQEPSLAGVTFALISRAGQADRELDREVTEEDGRAILQSPLISCTENYEFGVYAEAPAGYRATTAIRGVPAVFSAFEVGFVKEP